jgi:hypothetical protein
MEFENEDKTHPLFGSTQAKSLKAPYVLFHLKKQAE